MESKTCKGQQENRRFFIGGSDARIIMGEDQAALVRLWREKRGEVGPEDLSGVLVVQLGTATEELNRCWYERNTGHSVGCVQKWVQHPLPNAAGTGAGGNTKVVIQGHEVRPRSHFVEGATDLHNVRK